MATIHHEVTVNVGADAAWAALREVGNAPRLFAPVLTDGSLDGDLRTVTFANGMVVHERILDVDDKRHRVAYAALDGPGMSYHHASMQVIGGGPTQCTFVWITDFLPADIRDSLMPLIEGGAQALKSNLRSRRI